MVSFRENYETPSAQLPRVSWVGIVRMRVAVLGSSCIMGRSVSLSTRFVKYLIKA